MKLSQPVHRRCAEAEVRTHVTFRTTRFNQTEVRPYFINPNCFGDDCAAWLVAGLRERGWDDVSEPWQEDWGWQTSTARAAHKYLISLGLMEDDEPEWLIHVQEHTGFLARLLGKADPSALRDLVLAIHDVLTSSPDINGVRWHFEDLFMRGKSVGEADPLAARSAEESTA
jgi:hypothetical protein